MGACRLKIVTRSGGSESVFEAQGSFEANDQCERVRYPIEEDEGELIVTNHSLTMCRRGACGLESTFIEGRKTEMQLFDGELQGKIPVYTTRYRLEKGALQRNIELCYELFSAENLQTFLLKIQLFFSEEK